MSGSRVVGIKFPAFKYHDVSVGATIDVTTIWDSVHKTYRIGVYEGGKLYDITDYALNELSLKDQRSRIIQVTSGASSIEAALRESYHNDLMYRVIDNALHKGKNLFEFFARCRECADTDSGVAYETMAVPPDDGTSGLTNAVRTPKAGGIGKSVMASALIRAQDAAFADIPTGNYHHMAVLTARGDWCEFFPKADQAVHYAQPNGNFGVWGASFIAFDEEENVPILAASQAELGVLFDMREQQMVGYMPVHDFSFDVVNPCTKLTLPIARTFEGGMMVHSLLRIVEKPTDRVPTVRMHTSIYGADGTERFDGSFSTHDAVFGDTTGDGYMDYGVIFKTAARLSTPRLMLVATGAAAIPPKEGEGRVLKEGYLVKVGLDDMPDARAYGKLIDPTLFGGNPVNISLDRLLLKSL